MYPVNKEIAMSMLKEMPELKKDQLKKTLNRNLQFTSAYILEQGVLTIYKEGFYLKLIGIRSSFSLWAYDEDGKFVFGRKPYETKLHKIYDDLIHFELRDFDLF